MSPTAGYNPFTDSIHPLQKNVCQLRARDILYDGLESGSDWDLFFCGGQEQSPIDIVTKDTYPLPYHLATKFDYGQDFQIPGSFDIAGKYSVEFPMDENSYKARQKHTQTTVALVDGDLQVRSIAW